MIHAQAGGKNQESNRRREKYIGYIVVPADYGANANAEGDPKEDESYPRLDPKKHQRSSERGGNMGARAGYSLDTRVIQNAAI